jgi:hypothetical protein
VARLWTCAAVTPATAPVAFTTDADCAFIACQFPTAAKESFRYPVSFEIAETDDREAGEG